MLAGLLLLFAATFADQFIRYSLQRDHYGELQRTSLNWAARYRTGTVPSRIPTEEGDASIIQVVSASGEVVGTSEATAGRPLSDRRPSPENRIANFIRCSGNDDCLMISAVRADASPDSAVVYTATTAPPLLTGHTLEFTLLLLCLPLLVLTSWIAWLLTGRTLRPVEEIRSRIAEITASDLGLRVPVPSSSKELAALANTSNDTLSRLEKSVNEQRRFASDVAHELRNPIAGLSLRLEEALMDREEADPWEVIESSLASTERLSAIVDDLLTIARLQASTPKMEPINLGDFVTARALVHPQIRVEAAPGLLVEGNRIRLTRLLANLLNNAVRHAETKVEVKVEREGDSALLSVTDDGAGVPEADREKIFERFVRLEESKERDPGGTGLGLSISREIAEEHDGSLVLADSPRGACFELRLPLIGSAEEGPEGGAHHPPHE
ncbi:sensor histidine kinase [Actinocorallia populi]|uniref:sensor histidine kinase n=1 Tax=Actinocorallia populi TaxID=2079200 RepID=UPI000D08A125|nr:HAMP domain-containing sensor histidine kinase [Actinocorallia populi]